MIYPLTRHRARDTFASTLAALNCFSRHRQSGGVLLASESGNGRFEIRSTNELTFQNLETRKSAESSGRGLEYFSWPAYPSPVRAKDSFQIVSSRKATSEPPASSWPKPGGISAVNSHHFCPLHRQYYVCVTRVTLRPTSGSQPNRCCLHPTTWIGLRGKG